MSKDKKVGYKKPPEKHQFKKGTSGNPKGRSPGPSKIRYEEHLREDIFKIFDRKLKINIDGESQSVTAREAMYYQIALKAAQGDPKFVKLGHDIIATLSKDETQFRSELSHFMEQLGQFLLDRHPEHEDFKNKTWTMRDYYQLFLTLQQRWEELHEE